MQQLHSCGFPCRVSIRSAERASHFDHGRSHRVRKGRPIKMKNPVLTWRTGYSEKSQRAIAVGPRLSRVNASDRPMRKPQRIECPQSNRNDFRRRMSQHVLLLGLKILARNISK
jgi:hypothetical protein